MLSTHMKLQLCIVVLRIANQKFLTQQKHLHLIMVQMVVQMVVMMAELMDAQM